MAITEAEYERRGLIVLDTLNWALKFLKAALVMNITAAVFLILNQLASAIFLMVVGCSLVLNAVRLRNKGEKLYKELNEDYND